MALETPSRPPPLMANAIKNFHFDFLKPSLRNFHHRINICKFYEIALFFMQNTLLNGNRNANKSEKKRKI